MFSRQKHDHGDGSSWGDEEGWVAVISLISVESEVSCLHESVNVKWKEKQALATILDKKVQVIKMDQLQTAGVHSPSPDILILE